MNVRLALMQDLGQLKEMYRQIVKNMHENGIQIWDDSYPCEFFEEDIKNNRCYILCEKNEIMAAFVLNSINDGEKEVEWKEKYAKVFYVDRLGVNIKYLKQGIGSLTLTYAKKIAKTLGAEYLRLFVVDQNVPAIALYTKNNFVKAEGIYNETFDDGFVLHEYGYEVKLRTNRRGKDLICECNFNSGGR